MLIQTAIDIFWQTPHPPLHEIDLPSLKELFPPFNEPNADSDHHLHLEQTLASLQEPANGKPATE